MGLSASRFTWGHRLSGARALLACSAILLGACQSVQVTEEELAAAELWFFPHSKYVSTPRIEFTPAERLKALQTYRSIGANTLFAFLVDHNGDIRRVDLLRTTERRIYREEMLATARTMRFNGDPREGLFRCVFYPARWNVNRSFEWL